MEQKKSEPLKTLLTIVTGFLIVFFVTKQQWAAYTALGAGCAGLVSERLAKLIDRAWMKLAHLLSFVGPTILLSLVFFLILFPLSLLSKLFKKKDPLLLSNTMSSTFVTVTKKFSAQDLEKPW